MHDANDVISPRLGLPRLPVVDWPDDDPTTPTDPGTTPTDPATTTTDPGTTPTDPATTTTTTATTTTTGAPARPGPGLHWKTIVLARWATGRPFVWLDDEITDIDRRWVAAHHPASALLHGVDPRIGLADADLLTVRHWLDAI